MADETAVMDAPEVDTGLNTAVDTVDTSSDVDTDFDASPQGDTDVDAETASGPTLWRDAREQLKTLDPKLRSAIKNAIFRADEQRKAFPEGFGKVNETFSKIQSLSDDPAAPIEKVIDEINQERTFFRELDDMFTQGKPDFVERLAEAEPNAFMQMVPAALKKFSEVNPEGYSAYVSQAVLGHFNQAEVPLQFSILKTFLPQLPDGPVKDQVIAACETIYGAMNSLKSFANKPIVQKIERKQDGDTDQREQTLAEREYNATRDSWNARETSYGNQLMDSEVGKFATARKLTPKEKNDVIKLANEELRSRMDSNRGFNDAMAGYIRGGNQSAFSQRMRSEWKKIIPNAVRHAVDDVVSSRPKGQPAAQPTQKPGQPQQARIQPTNAEYNRIVKSPSLMGLKVDFRRTSNSMMRKNEAYIVGQEKPVRW